MATALTLSLAFALSCLLAAANPLRLLVLLPILAGAAELVENSILFVVVSNFPSEAGSFAGFVTSVKLVLGFTALPVALVRLVVQDPVKHLARRVKRSTLGELEWPLV